jgi:hypothetical protein
MIFTNKLRKWRIWLTFATKWKTTPHFAVLTRITESIYRILQQLKCAQQKFFFSGKSLVHFRRWFFFLYLKNLCQIFKRIFTKIFHYQFRYSKTVIHKFGFRLKENLHFMSSSSRVGLANCWRRVPNVVTDYIMVKCICISNEYNK